LRLALAATCALAPAQTFARGAPTRAPSSHAKQAEAAEAPSTVPAVRIRAPWLFKHRTRNAHSMVQLAGILPGPYGC
jgi:hypothetical protein